MSCVIAVESSSFCLRTSLTILNRVKTTQTCPKLAYASATGACSCGAPLRHPHHP